METSNLQEDCSPVVHGGHLCQAGGHLAFPLVVSIAFRMICPLFPWQSTSLSGVLLPWTSVTIYTTQNTKIYVETVGVRHLSIFFNSVPPRDQVEEFKPRSSTNTSVDLFTIGRSHDVNWDQELAESDLEVSHMTKFV